ncbi:hypothetical protein PTKIN_Ptkin18bG0044700 [Pterospermum kingtungense]
MAVNQGQEVEHAADSAMFDDFYDLDNEIEVDAESKSDIEVNIQFGEEAVDEEEVNNVKGPVNVTTAGSSYATVILHSDGDDTDNETSKQLQSDNGSDQDGGTEWSEFNTKADMTNPQFLKGMIFTSREVLKKAIKQYERYGVKLKRNDKIRVQGKCEDGCPWTIWATELNHKDNNDPTWQIKTYVRDHTCLLQMKNRNMTSS